MRQTALVAVLVLLAGCASYGQTLALDEGYRPLRLMVEDRSVPYGQLRTKGEIVYVHKIGQFLAADQVEQHAVLLHERVHSLRQFAVGVEEWCDLYHDSAGFRWAEECAGWEVQLRYEVQHGIVRDKAGTASMLAGPAYMVNGEAMVDYQIALAWVTNVIDNAGVY